MKAYRDLATLASLQVICFLLLTHLEPDFFLLHLYQAIIYMAILLMLFYMEDRWAYMIGMLAPVAWLILAYASGLLGGALGQVFRLASHAEWPSNAVSLVAGITALLAVAMVVICGLRWKRTFHGTGKELGTFLTSLGVVVAYYGLLVMWFWRMIPNPGLPE
ncbi:MAG: hypothetical protein LAN71_12830 [Acidobacteriia bacterium]|nr:hypothetical protein [Terriglobia bacterium]